jgi:hypothetical protein
MPNYKDLQNKIHWLDSAAHAHMLPAGCVACSDAEADALRAPTLEQVAVQAAEQIRLQSLADAKLAAQADATVRYLRDHTVAEVDAKIVADVTDFASAKVMLRKFGAVLCVLSKQAL